MLSPYSALSLLPFALAIGIWVSWSDMKFMKIPNKAVMAMAAVWLVVGILTVPFQLWLWAWVLGAAVLAIGFIANAINLVGAGDAKFAAAMAPVFIRADWGVVLPLFAACLLGAFVAHRLAGRINFIRNATADWASWTNKDFPMGLALSGTLIFYLLALVRPLL